MGAPSRSPSRSDQACPVSDAPPGPLRLSAGVHDGSRPLQHGCHEGPNWRRRLVLPPPRVLDVCIGFARPMALSRAHLQARWTCKQFTCYYHVCSHGYRSRLPSRRLDWHLKEYMSIRWCLSSSDIVPRLLLSSPAAEVAIFAEAQRRSATSR